MAIRVVLVDDHQMVREGIRSMLAASEGIEVVGEGTNGHEAVELAEKLTPDVILLDVTMPLMGGAETLARIKSDPQLNGIPVIMLPSAGRRQGVLPAGASDCLEKPFSEAALSGKIRGILGGKAPDHDDQGNRPPLARA